MTRTARLKSAERGDLTTVLPWLMEYTQGTTTRLQGPAHKTTDAAMFERAALACQHQGGITVTACGLLGGPRAPGDEATWVIVKTKFPEEDQNLRSGSSGGSWGASVTEPEEVSGPTWRPLGEFNPQVAFEVIYSRNQEQSDGLRFSHLQSIIRTQFGQ